MFRYDYDPPLGEYGDPRTYHCCWPSQFTAKLLDRGYPELDPDVAKVTQRQSISYNKGKK